MTIRVVTDSTADLPQELVQEMAVEVVPLKVRFGGEEFRDRVDLSTDEFYRRLTDGVVIPTTSQPSVGEFVEAYERLGQCSDSIVSVHISSLLSGTYNVALQASRQAQTKCPITVIDTLQASMGLGMVVVSAARTAQRGAGMDEVVEAARSASERCRCMVLLDTLEYLEKGGRIGKAKAMLGTLLRIKPMISVRDGEVHELAKERTLARAIARLKQTARESGPLEELSVLYSTTPDDARLVADDLRQLLPDGKEPFFARFGPVLGTYVGPGALGVGLLRAEP